jgi:hypothetical protein
VHATATPTNGTEPLGLLWEDAAMQCRSAHYIIVCIDVGRWPMSL